MHVRLKGPLFGAVLMMATAALGVSEGDSYPSIKIDGYQSKSFGLEQLRGKVTIINFWATWCEACKVELAEMQTEFGELFKQKDFQFLFVSLDKDIEKAAKWVKANMKDPDSYLKYLYKDPEFAAADALEVDSFPMTLVIDKQGRVRKIQRGFKEGEGSTLAMTKLVRSIL